MTCGNLWKTFLAPWPPPPRTAGRDSLPDRKRQVPLYQRCAHAARARAITKILTGRLGRRIRRTSRNSSKMALCKEPKNTTNPMTIFLHEKDEEQGRRR